MRTILAIDDQQDNLTTYKAVLKNNLDHCKVLTAISGEEGLHMAKTKQPDVILLDIIMPNLDGYEVCKRLKKNKLTKNIPIIMVTAIKTDTESRIKGLEMGADAFLSKPINPVELSAQIKVMLRIKKAEDELRTDKENLEEIIHKRTADLKESESQMRAILEAAKDVSFITTNLKGKNSKILSFSKGAEKIFGYKAAEVIGQKVAILHPKSDTDYFEENQSHLKGDMSDSKELILIRKSGEHFPAIFSHHPLYDNNSQINRTLGVTIDISERKQAEKALIESENQFRLIAENTSDNIAITTFDLKAQYIYVSPSLKSVFGYNPEDLLGKSFFDFIHPKDKKALLPLLKEYVNLKVKNLLTGSKLPISKTIEYRFKNKIGDWIILQSTINIAGKNLLAVSRDITKNKQIENELKKSEEDYRGLFENAHDAILIFSPEDEIVLDVNQRACEIYGFDRDEFLGMSILEISLKPSEGRKHIERTVKNGYFNEFESIQRTKDGSLIHLEINASIIQFKGQQAILSINRDITERKLAEAKLKEQAVFVQKNPAPVLRTQYDGIIISTNQSALNISDKIQVGKSIFELFKSFKKSSLEKDKKNKQIQFEETIGENTYLFSITKEVETSSIYFFGSDITKRKNAEMAFTESAEKYRNLYTSSNDAILLIQDNKFISCNPSAIKMYGADENEIVGSAPNKYSPKYQSDGKASSEKAQKRVNAALAGQAQFFEWTSLRKDGTTFESEISLKKMRLTDGEYLHAIVKDISERKRAELIQKVLYNISNAVLTTDSLKSFIEIISKELDKIIDTTNFFIAFYDQKTDTFSSPFFSDEMDNFGTWPAGKTLSAYVVKTSKSLFITKESILKMRDEGKIDIVGATPEVGMLVPLIFEGVTTGIFALQSYTNKNAYTEDDLEMLDFVSDQISLSIHRKKTDQDLKAALEQAKESDRLKSVFLATMSHELRTPLNAIIGFSDIIDIDVPKEEIIDYNKTINVSGTHLLSIVEDLFDITLIDSGEIKIFNEAFDLNLILKEIHEVIIIEQQSTAKTNVDIELFAPNIDAEFMLVSDPHKLKQILINLLKNALKFTHHGRIKYGYKLSPKEGAEMIEFSISDTGIGIQKDQFEFIFDAFRQVEDAHTRAYGGTGIGLSISKKLVGLLGGEMWLESKVGVGSKFYFTIPAIKNDRENSIEMAKHERRNKPDTKVVLIAEDDEASYEYLNVILRGQNINTIWAKNGNEAVHLCKENTNIDLVLMDINMPIKNGFEATQEIKILLPHLIIIAQTAYAIAGDKEKALQAGCDDYISKPIKKNGLITMLNNYLTK